MRIMYKVDVACGGMRIATWIIVESLTQSNICNLFLIRKGGYRVYGIYGKWNKVLTSTQKPFEFIDFYKE